MRQQRKVRLTSQVLDDLIPFLRNERIATERRERVAAVINTVKIATRERSKHWGDESRIPKDFVPDISEHLALLAVMAIAVTRGRHLNF